jgi:hypothetical protein
LQFVGTSYIVSAHLRFLRLPHKKLSRRDAFGPSQPLA